MTEAETRTIAGTSRRKGAVAHETAKDDLPLEIGQVMRDGLNNPVADHKVLRFAPAAWSTDAVVRGYRELRASVLTRLCDGEL